MLTLVLGSAGCDASIEVTDDDAGTEMAPSADAGAAPAEDAAQGPPESARERFDDRVLPILTLQCVSCHGESAVGTPFLLPSPDIYTTLTEGWRFLLDLDTPRASPLLTHGVHEGPAFSPRQSEEVAQWIGLEAAEAAQGPEDPEEPVLETDPVALQDGPRIVDLGVMGIPGAALSFIAERTEAGVLLNELRVAAGREGARLEHPVIVTWNGEDAQPDPVDRFAGIEVRVAPFTSAPVGNGSAALVGFPEDGRVSFAFDDAGPLPLGTEDEEEPGMGGCQQVDLFTMNAQPALGSACVACHAGGRDAATEAVDMTRLSDMTDEGQLAACNEILSRSNLEQPTDSAILRAPDPASPLTTHPFKMDDPAQLSAFQQAILTWLEAE